MVHKIKVVLRRENFDKVLDFIKESKKEKQVSSILLFDTTGKYPYENLVEVATRKGDEIKWYD
jgi:hypothetical protein